MARDYVRRTEEDKLIERIQKNDFIQVFGVSGIGKTSMITQVGWRLKKNFEKVIWLSGDNFSNISENTEYLKNLIFIIQDIYFIMIYKREII